MLSEEEEEEDEDSDLEKQHDTEVDFIGQHLTGEERPPQMAAAPRT